jgi:ubiquitin carboxyl-terminal hydrolase 20/33
MDFQPIEYTQVYDSQPGFDAAETAQLKEHQRMAYRHEGGSPQAAADRRPNYGVEPSRFGFGRYNAQKSKKGLLGLSNLGNTCFMNAALQCLTHTHGLQKYFRFCSHAYTSKSQSNRQKLLMSFAHWFERDWGKNVSAHYHSPEDILKCVQQLNPIFQGYAQQDSQEFLRCVLDNIHEELRREVPDDLNSHLLNRFGIEACAGEASSSSAPVQPGHRRSTPSGGADCPHKSGGSCEDDAESKVASRSRPGTGLSVSAPSTTRQFMQLCQSPEGVTDVGEIRLPAKAQASCSTDADLPGASASFPSSSGSAARSVSHGSEEEPFSAGREAGSERSSCCAASSSSGPKAPSQEEGKSEEGPSTHFASIVSELFQCRVVSMVKCLECHKTSRTQEIMYDVSVPIPNANEATNGQVPCSADLTQGGQNHQLAGMRGGTWTGMLGGIPGKVKGWFYDKGVEVTDCVRKYCAPEHLGGKDKYFCEHCKRKNDCEKRLAFKDLPEVLCIHIKRFRYDASWFNGTKNARVVTFPVNRTLDLSSFLDETPAQPVEYKLIGLIQHIGSMGGGHYIAYCQHKKKPQEWYEFDDLQVSMVSPEQVERAEPYVLFYQRVPSKGNKLDRQTFKNDMRRMQVQIKQYLMSHPALSSKGTSGSATSSDAASQPSMAAHAVAEEMRHHGPALRNLYRLPPAELDVVFVTKHWYVRLTTMSNPGPIDNFEYLCPHQLLGSYSSEMAAEPFIPISRSLFQSLRQKYGGGPPIHSLEICPKCQTHLRAYNERKQAEFDLVSKYDTKDKGDGKGWYLVDALWVNKWKRYVRAEHVTDIRDMCAPGSITNDRLFDKDNSEKTRNNLRLRLDYIGVNARVWWLFMHVHGGGPALVREELDIYSTELEPETELELDELRWSGNTDFARRVSRQLVDECHGDVAEYERRHNGSPMEVDTACGEAEPSEAVQADTRAAPEG